jgi:hypothetical protein
LDGAMAIDKINVCSKPPIFAALVPLSASFIRPLTTGLSYLLVTYGEADQASQQDSCQAYR